MTPMALPPLLDWQAEALAADLAPLWPGGVGVEVVASAASTNSELLAHGRAPAADGFGFAARLLVAEQQTGGRGRLGRVWQSQRGASLTCSLALPYAPADWSGLSLAVGVALAEALDVAAVDAGERPRIGLKWPNDLWLIDLPGSGAASAGGAVDGRVDADGAGRKLGGILIETVVAGGRRLAVIGIGLNVRPFAAVGAAPATPPAFLSELDAEASAPRALARLMPPLLRALRRFELGGFAAFAARYAARDVLVGRTVRLEVAAASMTGSTTGEPVTGVAEGVSAVGALRVRMSDGSLREVVGGEVSVRLPRVDRSGQPAADRAPAPSAEPEPAR